MSLDAQALGAIKFWFGVAAAFFVIAAVTMAGAAFAFLKLIGLI